PDADGRGGRFSGMESPLDGFNGRPEGRNAALHRARSRSWRRPAARTTTRRAHGRAPGLTLARRPPRTGTVWYRPRDGTGRATPPPSPDRRAGRPARPR